MPKPKASYKSKRGRIYIVVGIFAILIAVLFFLVTALNRANTMRFVYSGQGTQAVVEAVNLMRVPNALYITYKYTDDAGTVRHGRDNDPYFDDAEKLKVGQKIDIVYLMNFPDQSRLESKQGFMMERLKQSPWMSIAAIAVLGLLLIAIGM